MGRLTLYTPELAAQICERLAAGESLRAICRPDDMPSEAAVRLWALEDRGGFAAQYARARELQADALFEEIQEIADTPQPGIETTTAPDGMHVKEADMLGHRRLRVDTLKWRLARMNSKKYGDKITHAGDPEAPVPLQLKGSDVHG